VFGARDEKHNNAVVLRDLLESRLHSASGSSATATSEVTAGS
jgi:hypothetical protein